ncbi:hypothetical protein HGI43_04145 [Helicobacter pylori]|nr:hypothetical protein [Helicobacter pylori]QQW62516.1 hypothetical protein HGI43_04145 [Helicobacter pylori]
MRQTRETETSFNQIREITQSIQALQTNQNANVSELTPKRAAQESKRRAQAKKGVLKPTKKAFSERQKTTIRDKSQESANARTKNQPNQQKGGNDAKS